LNFRAVIAVLASVVIVVGAGATPGARAGDNGPVIVVPGRSDVPVILNGRDVSWSVVYGDWGLRRPGADLIIQGAVPVYPQAWAGYYPTWPGNYPARAGNYAGWAGYYPATGRAPAYGRREIEPPVGRGLPAPAPGYYRSWSAGSAPGPVTEYPPFDPPPVVLAPRRRVR
jgi:hypothetical protein